MAKNPAWKAKQRGRQRRAIRRRTWLARLLCDPDSWFGVAMSTGRVSV